MSGWWGWWPITSPEVPLLCITVNSPGEIYYWLSPLLEALSDSPRPLRVWVFAPPCQFRCGREEEIIQGFPLVERVFGPRETLNLCWGRTRVSLPLKGLVLFMGGDLLYARMLKERSGYPLWVYDGYPRRFRGVDLYLARFRKDFLSTSFPKKVFLGDLLRSVTLRPLCPLVLPEGSLRFLFLPGSRLFAYSYLLPFFTLCAEALSSRFPEAVFVLSLPGHFRPEEISHFEETKRCFHIFFGFASELIASASFIITVPGSNNFEILYRRKPGLVLLPLWKGAIEKVPIMGVGEVLGKIPLWGTIMKRALIKRMVYSSPFIALPNRVLGREALPELRGDIKVEEVVGRVVALLGKYEPSFNEEDFPPDAAQRLAKIVLEEFYG
ncbi:MAG: hypothetical protein ACUVTO_05295 [Candidatus Caldatribacteriaceae bacterium]